jgi:hypothetical protein
MAFIHNYELNPCKCGTKQKPDLDSDDMFPCWMVQCFKCNQKCHSDDDQWTLPKAVNKWNKENPIKN